MIGKDEEKCNDVDNTKIKTITEKRKTLQDNSAEICAKVTNCFRHLASSLKIREKQLLRQIEAIHNQQLSIIESNWELLPSVPPININLEDFQNIDSLILKLGRIELPDKDGIVMKDAEPYKVEEYEDANKDHVSFDKSIQEKDTEIIVNLGKKINLSINANVNETLTGQLNDFIGEIEGIGNNNCSFLCLPGSNSSLGDNEEENDEINQTNLRLDDSNANLCSNESHKELFNEKTPLDHTSQVINASEKEPFYETKIADTSNETDEQDDDGLKRKSTNDIDKLEKNEHPKQIQQWLQQILDETETEPVIHEIEHFAEIANARYRECEFPLKT